MNSNWFDFVSNTAGAVSGLGGAFSYTYSYDSLYRLDSSAGSSLDMPYTLAMAYSPSGNILRKTLSASKLILGNNSSESYDRAYSYNGAHRLSDIEELVGSDPSTQYGFDGSGNMTLQEFHDPQAGVLQRTLCWDEENRLAATRDNNYVTANIYDGSGMRAWKLAGELSLMWQNGVGWVGSGDLNLRTWYQSEHMTLTDQGYTKHYFIEGQRIASKLGSGFVALEEGSIQQSVEPIHSELSELPKEATTRLGRDFECLGLEYPNFYGGSERLENMEELFGSGEGGEPDVYFYHSDHLGSSSFITDGSAYPTQHLQYLPFGEDFIHQQNTSAYYTAHTFSGKERDFETGSSGTQNK